jgi:hypothetical protein
MAETPQSGGYAERQADALTALGVNDYAAEPVAHMGAVDIVRSMSYQNDLGPALIDMMEGWDLSRLQERDRAIRLAFLWRAAETLGCTLVKKEPSDG